MTVRLISKRELCRMVPYSAQHILRLEKVGRFPRRVRLGARRVAWILAEVEAWVAQRAADPGYARPSMAIKANSRWRVFPTRMSPDDFSG